MAYKKNVADIRESPAFAVIDLLKARKADVAFHDPFVDVIPPTREHAAFTGMASVALTPAAIASCDGVVIVTDHDAVDYAMVAGNAKLVVDTRNALAGIANRANIIKA
jgi:UDP-N-acetyl-D-glucosamine dehydrogenase